MPVRPYSRDVLAVGKLSKAQTWGLNDIDAREIDEIQDSKLQPKVEFWFTNI